MSNDLLSLEYAPEEIQVRFQYSVLCQLPDKTSLVRGLLFLKQMCGVCSGHGASPVCERLPKAPLLAGVLARSPFCPMCQLSALGPVLCRVSAGVLTYTKQSPVLVVKWLPELRI